MQALRHLGAASALGFAALAAGVALADDDAGDDRLLGWIAAASGAALDPGARLIDRGTGYLPMALVAVLISAGLLRAGRSGDGARVAVSVGGALAGTALLKRLVGRPRPDLLSPLADVSEFSFPSGHAAASAAIAAVAVLAAAPTRWRTQVVGAAILLALVAAAAQLVLARHHPSDILGGWLWAGAWTAAVWTTGRHGRPTQSS